MSPRPSLPLACAPRHEGRFLSAICSFGQRARHYAPIFALGALLGIASPAAHAACGREHVIVLGGSAEQDLTCRALSEVSDYFARAGYPIEFKLIVRFLNRVEMNASLEGSTEHWPVSGYYQPNTGEIKMTRSKAPWTSARRPWHLTWDDEIGFSILEHELIHAAIAHVMGDRYRRLPHAWHEALAYAIQLSLMKPELRERALANFDSVRAFSSPFEINEITYGFDPDAFAIAAYKTYVKNNGLEFLKKALNLEIAFADLSAF